MLINSPIRAANKQGSSEANNRNRHMRTVKQYALISPIRCKKKLLEVRLGKITERYSRAQSTRRQENENFILRTSSLMRQEKENSSTLFRNCREQYKKHILSLVDRYGKEKEFFSADDKAEICKDYSKIQKKIHTISKGVNRLKIL